jgi:hypothetical protein
MSQLPPAQGEAAAPNAGGSVVIRLPTFWTNSPTAWFQMAEAHFTLRRVTDPIEKFLADGLMALHTHNGQEVAAISVDRPAVAAAAATDDDDFVTAVSKGGKKQFKKKSFKKQNFGKQRKEFESLQSPLCYYHVCFGDKAHRCKEPCAWPAEN